MGTVPTAAQVCPSCSATAPASAEFCPSCLGSLARANVIPAPRSPSEAGEPVLSAEERAEAEFRVKPRGVRRADWRSPLLTLGLVVGGLFAVALGGVGWATDHAPALLWVGAAGCAIGAAASARFLLSGRRKGEVLPALTHWMASPHIYEFNDVQFSASSSATALSPGSAIFLEFVFQNCVDQPRRVTLGLDARSANLNFGLLAPTPAGYRFAEESTVRLGAGEIARLRVPIIAGPQVAQSLELWVRPGATGPVGKRVRYVEAPPFVDQVGFDGQVLGAVFGVVRWGGGLRFNFKLEASPAKEAWLSAPPDPTVEFLFSPSAEELSKASGSAVFVPGPT